MSMTVYMIVTNDKYRLPLYWGDSIEVVHIS